MPLDVQVCYRALTARDSRFDGTFFVGVSTTGIYCRPICPARTPKVSRCRFFERAAEAERAGFRACFRCRPELAPGKASVDSLTRLAREAISRIDAGSLNEGSIEGLAQELGVTSRHLRRTLEAEAGVSPSELAQSRRLAIAKQLLQDSRLPLAQVAFASGFSSVRRFNATVRDRFGRPPSAIRRGPNGAASGPERESLQLRLDYRPPLAWDSLLDFLKGRAIAGVETVEGGRYRRTVALGASAGWLEVQRGDRPSSLRAELSLNLVPHVSTIVPRLRALFDLDARPDVVSNHLSQDPILCSLVSAQPGLRVPGAFDGFELAVRAVLGQQISVRGATTLSGRLVMRFGKAHENHLLGLSHLFPSAETLANASVAEVQRVGLPQARARTLVALAQAIQEGRLSLRSGADPLRSIAELEALPGIGPWTAHYLAMRALRWPDAFPGGDLALRKALKVDTARAAEERAAPWQPWRAYAVMHLWSSLLNGG